MNILPLITTRQLGISFGGTRALDDVSCSFYEGQICALAGANGAGKSTLIKILCGYHTTYDGTICLHDDRCVLLIRRTRIEKAYARSIS